MQYDFKFISYVFTGFSLAQVLGISYISFSLWQSLIVFIVLVLLVATPGFLDWGSKQQKQIAPLSRQQIISSFMPSLVGIGILSAGFLIGLIAGY